MVRTMVGTVARVVSLGSGVALAVVLLLFCLGVGRVEEGLLDPALGWLLDVCVVSTVVFACTSHRKAR
jgi:hypothetical protein